MARMYPQSQDYDVQKADTGYAFPSTTDWMGFKGENDEFLIIRGAGAPGSNHNNADLGSLYYDYTNNAWYSKDATGANWATFTVTT